MVNVKASPLNNSVLADLNYKVGETAAVPWRRSKERTPVSPQEPVSGDPWYPRECWLNIHGGVVSVNVGWPEFKPQVYKVTGTLLFFPSLFGGGS